MRRSTSSCCATGYGIHPDQVRYVQGDTTTRWRSSEGTGGSRSATIGGSAVMLATEKIVAKASAIAAHMLEAAEIDIEFGAGGDRRHRSRAAAA